VTAAQRERQTVQLLRDLAPQLLGAVLHRFRDFAACEDAVQEAMIAAALQWPRDGLPDNPRGWLIQVALRRMTDHVRSEMSRRERESIVASETPLVVAPVVYSDPRIDPNDSLVLLFMCCHPALSTTSAIALTLRAVGGLTTAEIARAFLVPEATMAQRISRAKQTLQALSQPFSLPEASERAQRLDAVLHVLYLVFNEGYTASSGAALQRVDLAEEAIRLVRLLRLLLPDSSDVAALLALMLLTHARRAARSGASGELVPLDQQDRALWDRAAIVEGVALVSAALSRPPPCEYALQAAIAALHDEATSSQDTDWPQILALYDVLVRLHDSPVVRLNHAVAHAMVKGPDAGLALLDGLDGDARLAGSHRLDAVRAHLLERSGDLEAAARLYRAAAEKTSSLPERHYLLLRAARH
jgi:predicted RNA polymerase sigma factor